MTVIVRPNRVGKYYSIVDGKKKCKICLEWLSLDFFRKKSLRGCGLCSYCKTCENLKVNARRKELPREIKLAHRKSNLKKCYGLTLEDFEEILKQQDYKCAICELPQILTFHKILSVNIDIS